jgi:hypothetical protein
MMRAVAVACRWALLPSGRSRPGPLFKRIEEGDPGVGIGIYAAVLQALGLLEGLGQVADISRDNIGQALAAAELPTRVRLRRTSAKSSDA